MNEKDKLKPLEAASLCLVLIKEHCSTILPAACRPENAQYGGALFNSWEMLSIFWREQYAII